MPNSGYRLLPQNEHSPAERINTANLIKRLDSEPEEVITELVQHSSDLAALADTEPRLAQIYLPYLLVHASDEQHPREIAAKWLSQLNLSIDGKIALLNRTLYLAETEGKTPDWARRLLQTPFAQQCLHTDTDQRKLQEQVNPFENISNLRDKIAAPALNDQHSEEDITNSQERNEWIDLRRGLLEGKHDVNGINNLSPQITVAASKRHNKILKELLTNYGAYADLQSKKLEVTALMCAVTYDGDVETVQLLIDHGASVDLRNIYDLTALDYALGRNGARDSHYWTLDPLIKTKTSGKQSTLDWAIKNHELEIALTLCWANLSHAERQMVRIATLIAAIALLYTALSGSIAALSFMPPDAQLGTGFSWVLGSVAIASLAVFCINLIVNMMRDLSFHSLETKQHVLAYWNALPPYLRQLTRISILTALTTATICLHKSALGTALSTGVHTGPFVIAVLFLAATLYTLTYMLSGLIRDGLSLGGNELAGSHYSHLPTIEPEEDFLSSDTIISNCSH